MRSHLLLFVFLLAAPSAWAQTGSVAGTVRDQAGGGPLPSASVTLEPLGRGVSTSLDGAFVLDAVPAGTYALRASSVGYAALTQPVTVRAGEAMRVDVALTPSDARLDEVVVEGRAANLVGIADAASQGRVGQAELAARPLLRVGEVLETVPGLIVTQHSGNGKANQFFLRGFNLDHGTDFSASIEGVPMNLPTNGHGQGYLDLGSLIPELIDVIEFQKGPYHAESGDFSTAGSATIRLARRLTAGIARAEGGTDEYARGLFAQSARVGGGDLLYALNAQYYNGPWVSPENSTLFSGLAKLSRGTDATGASVTATGYHNEWDSTDQIAQRAVDAGLIDRFGTLDGTDGGRTDRYTLAGNVWRTTASNARTEATAYAAYYDLNLFSNFTYALADPDRGDQFEQADGRLYAGASASHRFLTSWFGQSNANTVGAAFRHDQIFEVALFPTDDRERIGTVRNDEVAETSAGAYTRNETRWADNVRTVVGLRGDVFRFDVASDIEENSGTETDAIASPSFSLAVGPWNRTEGYLNLGLGYHSNDARGTTIRLDPVTREPVERVDPLVRTRGAEVGVRTTAIAGLQSALSLWYIGLGSELVFVGDAGGTEASGATEHYGVEWNNYYTVTGWLTLDLDVALTESHFTDDEGEGTEIENSIGRVINGGVAVGRATGPLGSLRVRHFGPRPLTADNSVRSESTTLLNLQAGYRFAQVAVALNVLNLLDAEDPDVSYYYPSRLPGEPLDGIEDVHFHPVIPRTARLLVVWRF